MFYKFEQNQKHSEIKLSFNCVNFWTDGMILFLEILLFIFSDIM
jgi:hypothetical protein